MSLDKLHAVQLTNLPHLVGEFRDSIMFVLLSVVPFWLLALSYLCCFSKFGDRITIYGMRLIKLKTFVWPSTFRCDFGYTSIIVNRIE